MRTRNTGRTNRRTNFAMFAALWTLILAPALCTAGVLAHLCPCEDEVACEHESECGADPCSELAMRQPDGSVDVDLVVSHAAAPAAPVLIAPALPAPSCAPPTAAPRVTLPYPPGDLPLRI